jgi:hypothetical protein
MNWNVNRRMRSYVPKRIVESVEAHAVVELRAVRC